MWDIGQHIEASKSRIRCHRSVICGWCKRIDQCNSQANTEPGPGWVGFWESSQLPCYALPHSASQIPPSLRCTAGAADFTAAVFMAAGSTADFMAADFMAADFMAGFGGTDFVATGFTMVASSAASRDLALLRITGITTTAIMASLILKFGITAPIRPATTHT
jgi:hypothetical protein